VRARHTHRERKSEGETEEWWNEACDLKIITHMLHPRLLVQAGLSVKVDGPLSLRAVHPEAILVIHLDISK